MLIILNLRPTYRNNNKISLKLKQSIYYPKHHLSTTYYGKSATARSYMPASLRRGLSSRDPSSEDVEAIITAVLILLIVRESHRRGTETHELASQLLVDAAGQLVGCVAGVSGSVQVGLALASQVQHRGQLAVLEGEV